MWWLAAAVTLAWALIGAPSPARAEGVTPVEGPWTGITSVGLPVHFTVEGGNVVDVHWGFHYGECGNDESHTSNVVPIDAAGHWSFEDSTEASIEGTFVAAEKVEGTVSVVERMLPGCPATHATFVAIPGEKPPPYPPQYFAVTNVKTGYQERLPYTMPINPSYKLWLYRLKWRNWGTPVALGRGWAEIRRFKKEWNPEVHVRLSRPIPDGPHKRLYSVMRWTLSGYVPPRFPRHGELKFHRPRKNR
jgi:hypothetical protein